MRVYHKGSELNSVINETNHFLKANLVAISLLTLKIEFPFILIDNLNIIGQLPEILDFWVALVGLAFVFIVIPFSTGAQTFLYSQIVHGSEINYKECLAASRKQIFHMIIGSLLFFLMFSGGIVLFIVPGIIIGARLSCFPFFIMFDGLRPIEALQKSFNVTKGYEWKIAFPVLFFNVLIISASFALFYIISDKGFLNFLLWIAFDCAYAVLGWLGLIVAFRFYCYYKNEKSLN